MKATLFSDAGYYTGGGTLLGVAPTTMKMEIAGVPGVFGTLLCRPWSFAGMNFTMQ